LSIYNVSGRLIETLVNRKQEKGNYNVSWDGSELSEGIYFFTVRIGNNVWTEKIIKI